MSFFCWSITLNFVFQIPHLTLHFQYKYILITNWFYIMYIMHSCLLSYIYIYIWTTFVKATFSKSTIFKIKNSFEPNVLKWVIKKLISSNPFALLIINVKVLPNFQKEWCTFGRKKRCLKNTRAFVHFQALNALNMQKNIIIIGKFWACKICNY